MTEHTDIDAIYNRVQLILADTEIGNSERLSAIVQYIFGYAEACGLNNKVTTVFSHEDD